MTTIAVTSPARVLAAANDFSHEQIAAARAEVLRVPAVVCAALLRTRAIIVANFAELIARYPALAAQLTAIRNNTLAVIDALLRLFGCTVPSGP